ncbi:hypothetical protein [Billgrantia bachuensis]|uniref:Uncharacterized protein n=1 Tax=Billgrantia bachuensis TaxID=2717286 RepID=A0ABX0PWN8_9GAMM|nr:hypothetical protein [Halomonas bachuensis]NIC06583.1 hypothetical protein [Halomonas bachuensis]
MPTSDYTVGEGVAEPVLLYATAIYLIFLVLPLDFTIDYDFGVNNVLQYVKGEFGQSVANGAALSFFSSHLIAVFCPSAIKG